MARETRAPARQSRAKTKARRKTVRKKAAVKKSPPKRKAAKKSSPPSGPTKPANPAKPGRPFYSPEFLAEARRRIEHTTESMTSIAGKLGMHHSALSRLIQREGWLRPEASLPPIIGTAMRCITSAPVLHMIGSSPAMTTE